MRAGERDHAAERLIAAGELLRGRLEQPREGGFRVEAGFLGQFSAIDRVGVRAQVGGTLTEIHFKDGQIVHKGDLLFVIDPTLLATGTTLRPPLLPVGRRKSFGRQRCKLGSKLG
jgi:hypothetical protein